jgi:hypothetical protein
MEVPSVSVRELNVSLVADAVEKLCIDSNY